MHALKPSSHWRIAIVTSIHPDFDPRVWKHAASIAASGCEVHLVCPWNVSPSSVRDGVCFHPFARVVHRFQRPWLVPLRVLRTLLPLLRNIDLVHFHDIDLLPWMAALVPFRPVVYDVHENYAQEMLVRDWIPSFLRIPLYLIVRIMHFIFPAIIRNIVLVVPQQEAEFRRGFFRRVQVRNYASQRLLAQLRDDYASRPAQILFTGGHYKENGSWLLLDIAERLQHRGCTVPLLVTDRFGTADYEHRFRQEIDRRKLHYLRIIRSVPSPSIMEILNCGTIALIPSLPVPKVLMSIPTRLFEYMAAGLPVVSSCVGIQGDIITKAQCGLLVNPGDPDAFADAILTLLADRSQAKTLGGNGMRAFQSDYSWEAQIPALLNFYRQILANH